MTPGQQGRQSRPTASNRPSRPTAASPRNRRKHVHQHRPRRVVRRRRRRPALDAPPGRSACRRVGRGDPISSVPALFWLWLEHGGAYAATAVLGTCGAGAGGPAGASFARLALASASGAWGGRWPGWVSAAWPPLSRDLPTVPTAAARAERCARSCSVLPSSHACRRAMRTSVPSSVAERCWRWPRPGPCRCWCRSCPRYGGSAVLRPGRRYPAGAHIHNRRELPARRCAPDAPGSGGLRRQPWRPRRRFSAPWGSPGRWVRAPGRGRWA